MEDFKENVDKLVHENTNRKELEGYIDKIMNLILEIHSIGVRDGLTIAMKYYGLLNKDSSENEQTDSVDNNTDE